VGGTISYFDGFGYYNPTKLFSFNFRGSPSSAMSPVHMGGGEGGGGKMSSAESSRKRRRQTHVPDCNKDERLVS
jgi:hypothetical protein